MASTQTICTQSQPHAGAAHGTVQFAKGLWRAFWERRARKASVMLLSSLDNRTLDDIGLDRSEIESFVYDKSKERLRRYQPSWE